MPVRGDLLKQLQVIETHAQGVVDNLSVTGMVDAAVRAYLPPLVAQADRNDDLDLPPAPPDHDEGRVRLDGDLVFELDRVAAHIAAHGYGEATRGRLVTAAVHAYLQGFHVQLASDD